VGEKLLVMQEVEKKDIAFEFGIIYVPPSTLSTIIKNQDIIKNSSLNGCNRSFF
jgi:hypothetical protein